MEVVRPKNILSKDNVYYYRWSLNILLTSLFDGAWQYTHHFHYLKGTAITSDRVLIRKCLRTLEYYGLVINKNLGFNIHQWQITELGKEACIKLEADKYYFPYNTPNPTQTK